MSTEWRANRVSDWRDDQFKIGINMAGAVSAGAYTAGVLDFLVEAIEEWEKAKKLYRLWLAGPRTEPSPPPVPLHDVSIESFTGASAGGMCAAISSVLVQRPFDHIHGGDEQRTTNTFYEAWVNQINILGLLRSDGVPSPLTSILDCRIIDHIANDALKPVALDRPDYIAEDLTLFLTLTSARGIPYPLYAGASNTEEHTTYYADRLRFQVVAGTGAAVSAVDAKALPANDMTQGAWPLLREAAKATGAFPLFLQPRMLSRDAVDYATPGWARICESPLPQLAPAFPAGTAKFDNLYVDGGVTDNDPFQLAHDYLVSTNHKALPGHHNPPAADQANCAVLSVAPFPAQDVWDSNFNAAEESGVMQILAKLITVVVSQSRFQGESLAHLLSGAGFSRFVIAPSHDDKTTLALQCGTLSAFGGFFSRGFRKHDFMLGRYNCQQFLRAYFKLPEVNGVIAAGLEKAGTDAAKIMVSWAGRAPSDAPAQWGNTWIPLIPLCGSATEAMTEPVREKMTSAELDGVVDQAVKRIQAILPGLLAGCPAVLRWILAAAVHWPFNISLRSNLRSFLQKGLGDNLARAALLK